MNFLLGEMISDWYKKPQEREDNQFMLLEGLSSFPNSVFTFAINMWLNLQDEYVAQNGVIQIKVMLSVHWLLINGFRYMY